MRNGEYTKAPNHRTSYHIAAEFYYPKERRLDDLITKVWSTIADL